MKLPCCLLFGFHLARLLVASLILTAWTCESQVLVPITQSWRYSTNNLDSINWRAPAYAETGWSNLSPALLYIEGAALPAPKNTGLPQRGGGGPMLTYYFRTTFNVANPAAILSLTFSNLIDDGAIFYLNGVEIQRVGMPNTSVTYNTLANRTVGDATSFDIFSISGNLLTNLVNGNNVLAVEVHQVNATSTDIVFGSALLASTNITVTRGPYLQNGSHTNMTIRWRTETACVGRVRYGTSIGSLNLITDEASNSNEHEIRLTGLQPDTKYFYSVGTPNAALAGDDINHFLTTAPVPGTPKNTRIWVLGDSGTANANQIAVRNAYETFTGTRPTDLWLMLGDNAYDAGLDSEYQTAVFNIYTNTLRNSVLWPTLGNHDTGQATAFVDSYPYFDMFTLPKNGEAGGFASGTEHYYSFDYANIHFICLDSMTATRATNSPMFIWLTNDLANVTADWTIAYWHHPPYSRGSHNSDTEAELYEMRQVFLPILEDAGVDLVLGGHSHVYERSFLLDHHYEITTSLDITNKLDAGNGRENGTGAYKKPDGGPVSHQGTVYIVSGSAGQATGGTLDHPAMCVSLNNLGSLVLDVNSNRLDAKFIRENGTTNDYFTILKLNYPPLASNLVASVNGDSSAALSLSGSDINRNSLSFITNSQPAHGLLTAFDPTTGAFTYTPAHGYTGSDGFTFKANDGKINSASATVALNILSPQDTNANGIPDYWETLYGISDPVGDDDSDGVKNRSEYVAGTNPTNAASILRITSASRNADGSCTLSWQSVGGVRYRVLFRDGDPAGTFTEIDRPVMAEMDSSALGASSTMTFSDDFTLTGGAPFIGNRFYRIQVVE